MWGQKRRRVEDRTATLKEIRQGQRHVPNHVHPPKGLNAISELFANEIDRAIFAQLADFAEVANDYLDWGRWVLEQMPDTDLSNEHPSYGRRMRLFFNRAEVGEVVIQPGFGARIEKTLRASCSISLFEAQHIPYADVSEMLTSLGYLVANDNSSAQDAVVKSVKDSMLRFVWGAMVEPDDPQPLAFEAEGDFAFYFVRRRALVDKGRA